MKTIKFYRGEENEIVVEHDNYEESIFRDQNVKALLTVNRVLQQPSDREPSIVAFCGDRGEDGHRLTLGMKCGELLATEIEELELICSHP